MQDRQQSQTACIAAGWRDRLAATPGGVIAVLPGLSLCIVITALATLAQIYEESALRHAYVEALVIAILLGIAIRTLWQPAKLWHPGISFSAKTLLEIAVVLLGASISVAAIV